MINKDFPCKTCGHAADKHYSNISDGETVCTSCSDHRLAYTNEQFHEFIGDNLRYMELLNRREQIKNEY
jgi:hypothetical protein